MPLQGENRAIVKLGLKKMASSANPGLLELMRQAAISPGQVSAYHLGFVIGPRINAGGRLESAMDAVRLLTTRDRLKLYNLASKLNRLNLERQKLTEEMLSQAEAALKITGDTRIIFVSGAAWPEGVIGLVAGKLTEKYHLPSIAVSVSDQGLAKGSARSIKGFDITGAISGSAQILIRFGGHAQAAGFTLKNTDLDQLKQGLEKIAGEQLTPLQLERQLQIDAELNPEEITIELAREIDRFEPFGLGNPTPLFVLNNLQVKEQKIIGRDRSHIKLQLSGGGEQFEAIGFGMAERFAKVKMGAKINLVASLSLDSWNGRDRVQLKIKDCKNAA
jgi:single-stranded-DNA-specific exonuclease